MDTKTAQPSGALTSAQKNARITDALRWVAQEARAHLMGGDCNRTQPRGKLREALAALEGAYDLTTID